MENFADHFGCNFSYYFADSFHDELSTIINEFSSPDFSLLPLFLFHQDPHPNLNVTPYYRLGERDADSYFCHLFYAKVRCISVSKKKQEISVQSYFISKNLIPGKENLFINKRIIKKQKVFVIALCSNF